MLFYVTYVMQIQVSPFLNNILSWYQPLRVNVLMNFSSYLMRENTVHLLIFITSQNISLLESVNVLIMSWKAQKALKVYFFLCFMIYLVPSDEEINFSLGRKQTVLFICSWRRQLSYHCSHSRKGHPRRSTVAI